jgi:hypothetical protein
MTDSRKAAKMALKALKAINEMSKPPMNIPLAAEIDGAMDALRQAIEQAEKQKKLCKDCGGIGRVVCNGKCMLEQEPWDTSDMAHRPNSLTIDDDIQKYKRPWVNLTDEEIDNLELPDTPTVRQFVKFIEAKLKEKNNG